MGRSEPLSLFEEVLLLALHDEKGVLTSGMAMYAAAGGILAELLLSGRIQTDQSKKPMVNVVDASTTRNPILDEALQKIASAKRRGSMSTWISRIAALPELKHKIARRLCDRGLLKADEDKILFLFTRRIYPEVNPVPEKEIVERIRKAIFSDSGSVDARTIVLVSLADAASLLSTIFGRKEIKARRKRIEDLIKNELAGHAAKETIAAVQAVILMTTTVSTIAATS